ncbi:hypothetical protein SERLA73DRAFT_44282, partial [Serpula lacrymans var. lacrymans S7.3]
DEPKFYPFFKQCCGAIDSSHINIFVPDDVLSYLTGRAVLQIVVCATMLGAMAL